ncbi:CARDB domain-containing protein [Chloroflexota bacterium]
MAGSQAVQPPTFQVTNLAITPAVAKSGEVITISADVTNTSDTAGTYVATLWINDTVEAGKDVSLLESGEANSVSFTVTRAKEGSYAVKFERLSGSFKVTAPAPPAPTPAPPAPTPTPLAPTPTPLAPTGINWWLIGGIIAAVIIITVVVWLLVLRRRN